VTVHTRVATALLCGVAGALSAQIPSVTSTVPTVPCRGQRVDSVIVDAQAPTVAGLKRVPVLYDVVRNTHVVTRQQVIRGYMLLKVGDSCVELRRAESERILRAQPFIADASVDVVPNRRGGVNLEVRTIDEASIILSGSVSTSTPQLRGLRVGSGNVGGLGLHTSFAWGHQPVFDDRSEFHVAHYQFLGRPWVFDFSTARDPFGRADHVEMTLPFRTDVQRFAWRLRLGEGRGHAMFSERDTGRLALGFSDDYSEVGGIVRIGPPGWLSLVGLSMTNERSIPDTAPVRIAKTGFLADTAAAFAGRFTEVHAARINALLGVRGLRFQRVRGFDALRGTQDIPLGLQFGTLVGRGIDAFAADSRDLFVASDFYAGFGSSRKIYRVQMQGEGRRERGTGAWTDLVGSGRFSRYSRPRDWRTRTMIVEWSGTEKVRRPHSLSLIEMSGGVRGLRNTSDVGGRRAVARIGEQFYVGSPFDFGDLGLAWFADGGQLWAGDLPYGANSYLRGSAGASILLAVPRRSTRMWRLEFAVPINREPGGNKWEVRLSHSDRTAFFWREPGDVDAARARVVPASIYSWP
jgi:hypothetical protein